MCMKYKTWKKRLCTPRFWSRCASARPHFLHPWTRRFCYWNVLHGSDGNLPEGACKCMLVTWERDEALPSLRSSVSTEQNILSNSFIVQKNIRCGNASNCMVVLLFQILYLRETIVEFALHPQHEASCDSEIQTGQDFKSKFRKQLESSPTTSLNSEGKEETLECLKSWTELKKNEDGHWICKHLIYKDVVMCIYFNYRIFTLRLQ